MFSHCCITCLRKNTKHTKQQMQKQSPNFKKGKVEMEKNNIFPTCIKSVHLRDEMLEKEVGLGSS
jgi:hypothetical protein